MPDFSELYADMIKRHKGPKPHKAWVNDTFNSLPQGEHGNEYTPVPAVAAELLELQEQAKADINAIAYDVHAVPPAKEVRLTFGDPKPLPPIESVMHRLNGRPATFEEVTAPPLTFKVYNRTSQVHVGFHETLSEAVRWSRKPWLVVTPNRELLGSDFADQGDRILLAELGYFSIDLPKKRAAVDRQRQIDAYLDQAYDVLHLDRKAVHAMIAAKLEATRFDGIWARSTGDYSEACRKVDMTVLARSPAIAQSIQELGQ